MAPDLLYWRVRIVFILKLPDNIREPFLAVVEERLKVVLPDRCGECERLLQRWRLAWRRRHGWQTESVSNVGERLSKAEQTATALASPTTRREPATFPRLSLHAFCLPSASLDAFLRCPCLLLPVNAIGQPNSAFLEVLLVPPVNPTCAYQKRSKLGLFVPCQ